MNTGGSTMSQSDKTVRDGVILVSSYHFLLAILSLVGTLAIVIFAIAPGISNPTASNSIFLPIVGVVVGLFLTIFYGVTGSGLVQLKNSARMGAVFLALFGTIGGLFVLIGAGIPVVSKLLPDMASVAGVIVGGLCGYALLTVLDLAVLAFMFNKRVRSLFYGEPFTPERSDNSLASKLRSTFIDEPEEESEPAPVKKAQPKPAAPKRETPVRAASKPEELDAPGDLFTEPTARK
jgi:hypothetical protein